MIYLRKASLSIFIALAIATGVPTPWIPNPAFAQSSPAVQTVIAQGVGKDVEGAAKNAAENALTQVVGTFIQSDKILNKRTEINNGIRQESRSIDTKTREYSQGSIKSFEPLETSQDENGLVRVTARVEVRIEDFKAFVKKLAEGETPVGPDIYPKEETQREKKENAKEIIVNNVLMPIIEGSALEFIVGKPEIYSEWERSVPPQNIQIVRNLMQTRHAPRETLVVPVEIKINPSFLQNARQTVEAIAFEKRRVDMKLRGSRPCQEAARSIRDFDSKRDGLLSFAGNNLLSDIYFFKDVAETHRRVTSLAEGVKMLSLTDATDFLYIWANSFPNLLVSLLGSEGVVGEFIITRKQDKSSSDGRAFTDNGWSPLHVDVSGPGSCLVIEPTATMHLFLNITPDELQRGKAINVKMESN
jgi:hypothetical protein